MKRIILITAIALSLGACAGQYDINPDKETHERWILERHVEKSSLNRSFCSGKDFAFYSELKNAYSFACKGGGYTYLRKE